MTIYEGKYQPRYQTYKSKNSRYFMNKRDALELTLEYDSSPFYWANCIEIEVIE